MVVSSGTSNRHVASIAERLISTLKQDFGIHIKTEGMDNSDWVLIDCGDVIVHVFREEVRDFYQLERLWRRKPSMLSDLENV